MVKSVRPWNNLPGETVGALLLQSFTPGLGRNTREENTGGKRAVDTRVPGDRRALALGDA